MSTVLFYVNPFWVRGSAAFFEGALKKKLLPQIESCVSNGMKVDLVCNTHLASIIKKSLPKKVGLIAFSQKELLNYFGSIDNIEDQLYQVGDNAAKKKALTAIQSKVPFVPDVVICWETPVKFLEAAWPSTLFVSEMPGMLSRVPFPELYTLDVCGLFNDSILVKELENIKQLEPDPRASKLLDIIKSECLSFIAQFTPYNHSLLDPASKFNKMILVPLQVTDQYAYKIDSPYNNQLDFLVDVLSRTPPNVGVVVTQYVTTSTSERLLTEDVVAALRQEFTNFVYLESFDNLDNVSQYLLPLVDAVATISSSMGLQALLWRKDLIVFGNTHIKGFSSYRSIQDLCHEENRLATYNQQERLIKWMLSYQQPLAGIVLRDKKFLYNWLASVRKNQQFDKLPCFFDLSEDYISKFSLSIKKDRARSILNEKTGRSHSKNLVDSFRDEVANLKPAIISFDIFDTLVDRVVEQPVHVFSLIESAVEDVTEGHLANFRNIRHSVERELRSKLLDEKSEIQEITLDEIYDRIQKLYDISDQQKEDIKKIEIDAELKYLKCRNIGYGLFKAALESGSKVVFISDMYLPQSIVEQVLMANGYPADVSLYLSSTIGLRKHEGDLFEYVSGKEEASYKQWLHVGDNPHGDYKVPKEYGISCFPVISAYKLISKNKKWFPLLQQERKNRVGAESVICGLIQKRFFDNPRSLIPENTHFGGDPFILGYVGLGQVLYGFLHWVMCKAKEDGIDKLLFLSRDGKILWDMACTIFPEAEGWPATDYVYSSRRAARVASLRTASDISNLIDSSISTTTLDAFFEKKFGISLSDKEIDLVKGAGFRNLSQKVSAKDREKLRQVALSLSNKILELASEERKLLSEYYSKKGVREKINVAVVDIGYAGTMQVAMESITQANKINGYYYITFDSASKSLNRTGSIKGYAGDLVRPSLHGDLICTNGFLYETLFCCSDPSFLYFSNSPAGMVPVFDHVEGDAKRRSLVDMCHAGVMALAQDLKSILGENVTSYYLRPEVASSILSDFIKSPSGRDAEIFEGCVFDDGFSANSIRYIVPPRSLILKDRSVVDKAIWCEGTSVFARRPDIFGNKPKAVEPSKLKGRKAEGKRSSLSEISKIRQWFLKLEYKAVSHISSGSGRKFAKYKKNRKDYFQDAKDLLGRAYWNSIGKRV